MKKTISTWMLALILVAGAFVSCSKSGDKPAVVTPPPGSGGDTSTPPPPVSSYFVKMKIDGVQKEFTSVAAINQSSEDDGYALIISATKDANSTEEIDLVLSSAGPIAAGEYVEGEHDTYLTWGLYAPENATDEQIFYSGVTLNQNAPYKVKITEITDKVVKGTFSGSFYDGEGQGANKKVITEGQFSAQIQD